MGAESIRDDEKKKFSESKKALQVRAFFMAYSVKRLADPANQQIRLFSILIASRRTPAPRMALHLEESGK